MRMAWLRGGVVALGLGALGVGLASANSVALDPNRVVPGSCARSYVPIFEAARQVMFTGDYARLAVSVAVTRDPETGAVVQAAPSITEVSPNLSAEAQAAVVEGVQRAYLAREPSECLGVISARTEWVIRFGEPFALAAPDNPLVINRASASTRLRNRSGAVELLDPWTARSRLTQVPSQLSTGAQCYPSELWRDYGPLPPVQLMQKGDRYRVQFFVSAEGSTRDVELRNIVTDAEPSGPLRAALEAFVREARFYPPVTDDCRTRNALGVLYVGRD